jgi:galactokinase
MYALSGFVVRCRHPQRVCASFTGTGLGKPFIVGETNPVVNKQELHSSFQQVFGNVVPSHLVRAPGRVNLIGEHTDYNDGFVLPIAMSQALYVLAAESEGDTFEVHSTAFDQRVSFPAHDPGGPAEPSWSNYVRGVAAMLRHEGLPLKPGRLLIHSEVPIGGGVSSSAALEIGTAKAMLALAGQHMDDMPLALLARRAEHEYANSPCGIMDQFICTLGQRDHALLLDCRSQTYEQLPLWSDDTSLLIINTQVKHEIGSSEYPVRQQQCRAGLEVLQKENDSVRSLRDVDSVTLRACESKMDSLVFERCWHVVTEIERTVRAADVLRGGDLTAFGKLMLESHDSLSHKYEVSCPELDAAVDIVHRLDGVYGARMTGGGFGGCAIVLARQDAESTVRDAIEKRYNTRFDQPALIYTTTACDGARVEAWG